MIPSRRCQCAVSDVGKMTVPVVAEDEGQGCIAVSSVRPQGGGAPRMRLDRRCADRVIAQNRGPLVFRFRRMVFRAARNPEAQPVPPDQSTRLGLWVRESIPSCCASRRASDRRAERVGKGRRLVAVVRGEYSNVSAITKLRSEGRSYRQGRLARSAWLGSRVGSQHPPQPGHHWRRREIIAAGQIPSEHLWATSRDGPCVYGMQEVRGSNPRSSTSQFKAANSKSRRRAAF